MKTRVAGIDVHRIRQVATILIKQEDGSINLSGPSMSFFPTASLIEIRGSITTPQRIEECTSLDPALIQFGYWPTTHNA
jgi:hypothetical protein